MSKIDFTKEDCSQEAKEVVAVLISEKLGIKKEQLLKVIEPIGLQGDKFLAKIKLED